MDTRLVDDDLEIVEVDDLFADESQGGEPDAVDDAPRWSSSPWMVLALMVAIILAVTVLILFVVPVVVDLAHGLLPLTSGFVAPQ